MSHSDFESEASGESQESLEMLGKFCFYFVPRRLLSAAPCFLGFTLGLGVLVVVHVVSAWFVNGSVDYPNDY